MPMLDHWHPVLPSARLKGTKPIGVKLGGRPIALFRDAAGVVGALDDVCPHRRMRLSLGAVVNGKLQCPYHGWTFNACGQGESPGTPKMHACATSFEAREAQGHIWVRARGAQTVFPNFDVDGMMHIGSLIHTVKAPLEVTLDNFCEIEHTPTTHAVFGYELDRMHEVKVRFEPTETTVRVINEGPPKKMPFLFRLLLGILRTPRFNDDWTTHFSPVYSVYDHWWDNPITGRQGKVRWRLYMFFVPTDTNETEVTTFAYAKSNYPGPGGLLAPFCWLLRKNLDYEIELDRRIIENLASQEAAMEGMKLSRFDRALALNRERIQKVYYGTPGVRLHA